MEKEVIHVGLSGGKGIFGGRETPLEASVIRCGMKDVCSIFAQGQCAAIRVMGRDRCKHGTETVAKGYTSRAKKYYEFKRKWENDEKYDALKSSKHRLAIIGTELYFRLVYINLTAQEDGQVVIGKQTLGTNTSYVPIEQFDEDFIYKVCEYRPEALMGGVIREYAEEQVPLFLSDIKALLPDMYGSFIQKYPEYDKEIDYVGRKALLKTLAPGKVEYKSRQYPHLNSTWLWDGEFLNYVNGYVSAFGNVRDFEVAEIRIKPGKDTETVITDNSQVVATTVFLS